MCSCHGDEEKALNLFFDLYYEFMHLRMKRYWKHFNEGIE